MSVLQGIVSVLGRLLLAGIFLSSAAMNKIPNFQATAGYMEKEGVPLPQAALALAIVFLLVGGVSLLIGWHARFGAALLAVFLALATYYFHDFWTFEDGPEKMRQMADFLKNSALFGAMLFVMANGAGAWSVDACCRSKPPASATPTG